MYFASIVVLIFASDKVQKGKQDNKNKDSLGTIQDIAANLIASIQKISSDVVDLYTHYTQESEKFKMKVPNDVDTFYTNLNRFINVMRELSEPAKNYYHNEILMRDKPDYGIDFTKVIGKAFFPGKINVEEVLRTLKTPTSNQPLEEDKGKERFPFAEKQNIDVKLSDTKKEPQPKHGSFSTGDNLHKYHVVCEKNPCHEEFIPADRFTEHHLPENHRNDDMYQFIKATADLTVRVAVKMTSPNRPKFWPKTKYSYPFYNIRGRTILRQGSGMVRGVNKFNDGDRVHYGDKHLMNYTTCWCKTCQHSDTASSVWWEFNVVTAAHVVFDDIEASHTSLRLFYDREESPVVVVDDLSINFVDVERDICEMNCVTCDKNLADKLSKIYKHYNYTSLKVTMKYKKHRAEEDFNFIVSHPHGCSKQISFGHWVNTFKKGDNDDNSLGFTYTTCTCPGSAGATVNSVGYFGRQVVHTGTFNSKVNGQHMGFGSLLGSFHRFSVFFENI